MSFLFKDFLNLDDVAEYLNQHGYSYNPDIEEDYYRLKDTVLDLYNEQKLSIVFYYDDFATIKTLQIAESGSTEQVEEFEFYISGYFHAPEATSVLKDGANLRIIQSYYSYYLLHDKDELPIYDVDNKYKNIIGTKFTSIEFGDDIAPSIIEFSDIRFPKADLDKLFSTKHDDLNSIKNELADVKAQNAKLIANIKENKTTGSFSMGTPAVAHVELETNEQLRKALADANEKIIQQAQDISSLNKQSIERAENDNALKPKAGISFEKQQAKEAAAIIARLLWELDTNKQIKMTDMCHKVYSALHNSAFYNQLPDQPKSIKQWIASTAPQYASKAGRPSEEPIPDSV